MVHFLAVRDRDSRDRLRCALWASVSYKGKHLVGVFKASLLLLFHNMWWVAQV